MAAEITALPTPPSRSDPVNFSARADAFLGALPLFQTEANTLATEAEADASLAETKRNEASVFASNALASANAAASSFDSFDDRYLGSKASAPTVDNDGQTLLVGALYFDTTLNRMRVRNSANNAWLDAYYTDENLTVTNLTVSGALSLPDGAVTLGTETQGNYVATVGAGTSGAQTGSSGLSITGTGEGATVTIAHADTSSQASVNNSGNTVIQDIVLDDYGHITSLVSTEIVNISGNAATATALQTARNINGVPFDGTANVQVTTAGSGIAVAGAEISHADTSSQASVDNSNRTFIRDITLDTFGHITSITSASVPDASFQLFTSSGTFTVPAGVTSIEALVIAGGGSSNTASASSGDPIVVTPSAGGFGGLAYGVYSVTPGDSITATVGAGGSLTSGGSSSLGGLLSATGGTYPTFSGTSGSNGTGMGGNLRNGNSGNLSHILSTRIATINQSSTTPVVFSIGSSLDAGSAGYSGDGNSYSGVGGLVLIRWG